MLRIFCFFMLLVARQATAELHWEDLIDHQGNLEVYGNAGLQVSSTGSLDLDSIQTEWAWSRIGLKLEQQAIGSDHVLRVIGEGDLSTMKLTSTYAERVWNFPKLGVVVKGGQFRNRALGMLPAPLEITFLRLPDASRRFTPYTPGLALSGQTETNWGQLTAEFVGFKRARSVDIDTMFLAFDQLEASIKGAYYLAFTCDWGQVEAGWEQDVGHIVTFSTAPFAWLQPMVGWSYYFHPHEQRLPDNICFIENTAWMTPVPIGLSTRLDFGDQTESLQAGLIWEYLPNCLIEAFWETRGGKDSFKGGLTCSLVVP